MDTSLRLPDLKSITINDGLWSMYTNMVAKIIVPYQWDILNNRVPDAAPSYCLDNFYIASGEFEGKHRGVIFTDSDVYKWLETVAYCINNGSDFCFEDIADSVIALIGRAQQPDGYLNTYYTVTKSSTRWTNLVEGHELYCAGHLIEAAVAYFDATGKDALLKIACRFADLICTVFGFGETQCKGYPGHQEIELALIKLYRCTGEKRYLSCARFFIEQRGQEPNYLLNEIAQRKGYEFSPEFNDYELKYAQAHMPPRRQRTAEGHAVRAMYMYCAMADLAQEDGDDELMETCKALWCNVTKQRMYITGGIGSSSISERFTTDYHLPNDSAYCETCASIGLALFGRRMAAIEHDAGYYDVVERVLYNAVLAGISLEGDRYFYANPLEVQPDACLPGTSLKHVKPIRQRWFDVACCPTNLARTLASLGQYIYAQDDNNVYVNLFISSSFKATTMSGHAEIRMDSRLMQDGIVMIHISAEQPSLSLAVRIPDYAENPIFVLDGNVVQPAVERGYAVFYIPQNLHTLEIRMSVESKWTSADSRVWHDAGKVALTKGPCIYCLEETDNGSNLASIYVSPDAMVKESVCEELPGDLPLLTYKGRRLTQTLEKDGNLYSPAKLSFKPVSLTAVPYCMWCNRKPGEMVVWQKVFL